MPEGQPGPGGATPPGSAPPSAAPASPEQQMLAQMYQVIKQLAQTNPAMSAGLQKAAQGIQEAQNALLMNRPGGPSPDQNPPL